MGLYPSLFPPFFSTFPYFSDAPPVSPFLPTTNDNDDDDDDDDDDHNKTCSVIVGGAAVVNNQVAAAPAASPPPARLSCLVRMRITRMIVKIMRTRTQCVNTRNPL